MKPRGESPRGRDVDLGRLTHLVEDIRNILQASAAPTNPPGGAAAEGRPTPAPHVVGVGQPCCNHADGTACQRPMLHDGPHL